MQNQNTTTQTNNAKVPISLQIARFIAQKRAEFSERKAQDGPANLVLGYDAQLWETMFSQLEAITKPYNRIEILGANALGEERQDAEEQAELKGAYSIIHELVTKLETAQSDKEKSATAELRSALDAANEAEVQAREKLNQVSRQNHEDLHSGARGGKERAILYSDANKELQEAEKYAVWTQEHFDAQIKRADDTSSEPEERAADAIAAQAAGVYIHPPRHQPHERPAADDYRYSICVAYGGPTIHIEGDLSSEREPINARLILEGRYKSENVLRFESTEELEESERVLLVFAEQFNFGERDENDY